MTEAEVEEMFTFLDKNSDKEISMIEFSNGLKKWKPKPKQTEGAPKLDLTPIEAFADIDTDGSGKLSMEELSAALTAKSNMSDEQVQEIFTVCDKNKDGEISMIEFTN